MKIKDDKGNFENLVGDDTLWNEIVHSNDRNAVLMSGAAFDIKLERILSKKLLEGKNSQKLISGTIGRFASRIDLCFALGLISNEEKSDLHIFKEIRNAFAHNLFGCNLSNPDVQVELHKLILPKKAGVVPAVSGDRVFFNVAVLTMDTQLAQRLEQTKRVAHPVKIYINGK
ncbi:MAG: hypothetical protein GY770_02040 [Aestuariibacter sp.]|nr:hypothetical protein [Aestuariibacter sp.]MCP4421026.1 hypothetical protein [Chloroflexota bacterium]MCP5010044.1 hypothetical protein [Aestuariibacter sp.]